QCSIWNADGTCRTAPKKFSQAYTIHGHNEFSMKPLVFAALPDKSQDTYFNLLQSFFYILNQTAFIFPNAKILFCHFHFAKNIIKHLKKLHLHDELKRDDVKREVANILSLPLLPPSKIIAAFYDSSDVLFSINSNFETFISYVEKNYIISPKFQIINWNHYDTLCIRPTTNNHRLIAKPNIWKWIMHIQKDDEQTIFRSEQEKNQHRTTRPRKNKNVKHDMRLDDLKAAFENHSIDIIQYQKKLRIISYSYITALENTLNNTDETS
ncbi:unnamed protein product, partial [Rotaria magnacalcarata]